MATSSCACSYSLSKSPLRNSRFTRGNYHRTVLLSSVANGQASTPYKNTLIFEATRLLGPPARFEASKLKVDFRGEEVDKYSRIVPRIYTLSHCDFTANLTLIISNILGIDQLRGWYNKDDVVAEWKEVKGNMCMHVHCYVSGPNLLFDLTAEFRYHIFSKELPLVSSITLKFLEAYGAKVLYLMNNSYPSLVCIKTNSGPSSCVTWRFRSLQGASRANGFTSVDLLPFKFTKIQPCGMLGVTHRCCTEKTGRPTSEFAGYKQQEMGKPQILLPSLVYFSSMRYFQTICAELQTLKWVDDRVLAIKILAETQVSLVRLSLKAVGSPLFVAMSTLIHPLINIDCQESHLCTSFHSHHVNEVHSCLFHVTFTKLTNHNPLKRRI